MVPQFCTAKITHNNLGLSLSPSCCDEYKTINERLK